METHSEFVVHHLLMDHSQDAVPFVNVIFLITHFNRKPVKLLCFVPTQKILFPENDPDGVTVGHTRGCIHCWACVCAFI